MYVCLNKQFGYLKYNLMKNETKIEKEAVVAAKQCGCGKTKDANGNCDGSHAN
jgi:CDGSH-type Zn-finger protein